MTSIKDIAQALKISKTTVSWVLSGKGDERKISMKTQERVLKYASGINYRPNLLAKSLNSGVTKIIGLVIPFISDQFYAQVAHEIEREGAKKGYTITICSSNADSDHERKMIEILRSKKVDGLIVATTESSRQAIELLLEDNYPFVLIDRFIPHLETNTVLINNHATSYTLVNCLLQRKAKNIAILTTDVHLTNMQLRYQGYSDALSDAHIPLHSDYCIRINRANYQEDVNDKLEYLFQMHPEIDGLLFTTHYLALEGLRYFYKKKIDFNHTLVLACIYNIPAFEMLAPQMIVAAFPIEEMGKEAVRLLIDSINGATQKNEVILSTQILLP